MLAIPGFFIFKRTLNGFTLVELSIVLVIIGLVIGGVVVGRDLISSATIRAQITQIEISTAVNTFKSKYDYLPGDIPDPYASQYGFPMRGAVAGEGDGNGLIEYSWGGNGCVGCNDGAGQGSGETGLFWVDLSRAHFIEGNFTAVVDGVPGSPPATTNAVGLYMPAAKMGNSSYVYVWSGGPAASGAGGGITNDNSINYFAVESITSLLNNGVCLGCPQYSTGAFTVQQANSLDTKIDDGLPQSGGVIAAVVNPAAGYWGVWMGAAHPGNTPVVAGDGINTAGSSATCYDNNNAGGTEHYSMGQNNGAGLNCALSFRFQ